MAAAPSSLGTQIREELTCSICLELFTKPKVLPCGHTFCQGCLQGLAVRGGTFQCPNCRRQVDDLPPHWVAGLPDSLIIANLCERLQTQAVLSEETREQPQSGNRCSFHPSEEVRQYCKQCKVPVCHECFEESHDEHPTMSLKKAIQQERESLVAEARNILKTYCSFIRYLRDEEKILDDQKQQTDSKIMEAYRQACNKMHQILTEEKDRLLSEAEGKHKENKKAVQSQRDAVLIDVAELSSACDEAELGMASENTRESKLVKTVGKFRGKTVPVRVPTLPAVFEPTEKFACILGKVTTSRAAAMATGHNHGNASHTVAPMQRLTFGGKGLEPGQFRMPIGVTVSEEGEVFVADLGNKRIQVFALQGTFVRQFPTVSGEEVLCPSGVAIDGHGNLWVVGVIEKSMDEMDEMEISKDFLAVQYDKQGWVLRKFDLQETTCFSVSTVAVNTRRDHILITRVTGDNGDDLDHDQWDDEDDNPHGEVLVFRPDGTLVRTLGQQQGMRFPWYITVGGEGNIMVSDRGNHCVYVYNEDGQFLFKFGCEGSGEGQLMSPCGICTDRRGNIIVADFKNSRVEQFDETGRFVKHITTGMKKPCAVAMTPQGQLVVTDVENRTVTIVSL